MIDVIYPTLSVQNRARIVQYLGDECEEMERAVASVVEENILNVKAALISCPELYEDLLSVSINNPALQIALSQNVAAPAQESRTIQLLGIATDIRAVENCKQLLVDSTSAGVVSGLSPYMAALLTTSYVRCAESYYKSGDGSTFHKVKKYVMLLALEGNLAHPESSVLFQALRDACEKIGALQKDKKKEEIEIASAICANPTVQKEQIEKLLLRLREEQIISGMNQLSSLCVLGEIRREDAQPFVRMEQYDNVIAVARGNYSLEALKSRTPQVTTRSVRRYIV